MNGERVRKEGVGRDLREGGRWAGGAVGLTGSEALKVCESKNDRA